MPKIDDKTGLPIMPDDIDRDSKVGITTVKDILNLKIYELLTVKNIGINYVKEIMEFLYYNKVESFLNE